MTAPDLHHRPGCGEPPPVVTVTRPSADGAGWPWKVARCSDCGAVAVEPLDGEED
ncbi:MAG: hypothetical protein R2737_07870 [Candidatus Nanopelagicales bacterium]